MATLVTLPSSAVADGAVTRVLALGCYLEIPAGYVFNTREREHFTWYATGENPHERISIHDDPSRFLEGKRIIDQRQEGHLTISTLELPTADDSESLPHELRRYLVISSESQALLLWGVAEAHSGHIIDSCLANPAPR